MQNAETEYERFFLFFCIIKAYDSLLSRFLERDTLEIAKVASGGFQYFFSFSRNFQESHLKRNLKLD